MNWKRGFRRITFVLAMFMAITFAGLSVDILVAIANFKQCKLLPTKETVVIITVHPPIEKKPFDYKERQRPEVVPRKLKSNYLPSLSKPKLTGLCVAVGLLCGLFGYGIVFLICRVLEWIVLGFCYRKPKAEQKQ